MKGHIEALAIAKRRFDEGPNQAEVRDRKVTGLSFFRPRAHFPNLLLSVHPQFQRQRWT
jgi:hypothetical protein